MCFTISLLQCFSKASYWNVAMFSSLPCLIFVFFNSFKLISDMTSDICLGIEMIKCLSDIFRFLKTLINMFDCYYNHYFIIYSRFFNYIYLYTCLYEGIWFFKLFLLVWKVHLRYGFKCIVNLLSSPSPDTCYTCIYLFFMHARAWTFLLNEMFDVPFDKLI